MKLTKSLIDEVFTSFCIIAPEKKKCKQVLYYENMITKAIVWVIFLKLIYDIFKFFRLYNIGISLTARAQKYEQENKDTNSRILIFGDSTAVGTGASNKDLSTVGLLAAKYPSSEIQNFGINGAKLKDLIDIEMPKAKDESADIVIIQAGANDIVRFTKISEVEKNLKEVINLAKKKLKSEPACKIIILHSGNIGSCPIFPFYASYFITKRTRVVRDIYLKIIQEENNKSLEKNIFYVDLFQEKNEDIFLSDPKKFFASDSFHPGDAGYKYWFDKIYLKLL